MWKFRKLTVDTLLEFLTKKSCTFLTFCGFDTVRVRRSRWTRLGTGLLKAWLPNPLCQLWAENINYHTNPLPFLSQIVIGRIGVTGSRIVVSMIMKCNSFRSFIWILRTLSSWGWTPAVMWRVSHSILSWLAQVLISVYRRFCWLTSWAINLSLCLCTGIHTCYHRSMSFRDQTKTSPDQTKTHWSH